MHAMKWFIASILFCPLVVALLILSGLSRYVTWIHLSGYEGLWTIEFLPLIGLSLIGIAFAGAGYKTTGNKVAFVICCALNIVYAALWVVGTIVNWGTDKV